MRGALISALLLLGSLAQSVAVLQGNLTHHCLVDKAAEDCGAFLACCRDADCGGPADKVGSCASSSPGGGGESWRSAAGTHCQCVGVGEGRVAQDGSLQRCRSRASSCEDFAQCCQRFKRCDGPQRHVEFACASPQGRPGIVWARSFCRCHGEERVEILSEATEAHPKDQPQRPPKLEDDDYYYLDDESSSSCLPLPLPIFLSVHLAVLLFLAQ